MAATARAVAVTAFVEGTPLETLMAPPYGWDMPRQDGASPVNVRVTARDEHGHEASEQVRVLGGSLLGGNAVPSFRSDTQAVTINLGVFDSWKRRILDLQRDEIIVRDNGQPQEILGFGREDMPLRTVVLFDRSGSMDGRMEMTRQALDELLSRLDARDQSKLVAFNDRVNQLVDFTGDHDAIRAGAATLEAGGGTALYDAILFALQSFETDTSSPTRAGHVCSSRTGWDQDSVNPMSRVLDRVRDVGATIFAVGYGEALESDELRATLVKIARSTGGEAFFVPRTDHLAPIFAQIARRMRAMYFVSFVPDNRHGRVARADGGGAGAQPVDSASQARLRRLGRRRRRLKLAGRQLWRHTIALLLVTGIGATDLHVRCPSSRPRHKRVLSFPAARSSSARTLAWRQGRGKGFLYELAEYLQEPGMRTRAVRLDKAITEACCIRGAVATAPRQAWLGAAELGAAGRLRLCKGSRPDGLVRRSSRRA